MKLLLKRLQDDWPSWLAVSFFALLPFSRLAEIPLSALGPVFAVPGPFSRTPSTYPTGFLHCCSDFPVFLDAHGGFQF